MRPSLRSTTSSQSYDASSSGSESILHHAASRRLATARAPSSLLSSQPSSRDYTPASPVDEFVTSSKNYPSEENKECLNFGLYFEIQWDCIWKGTEKLAAERLGYRVVNKRHLQGSATRSEIYKYGADLLYKGHDGKLRKLWLCERCHKQKKNDCAKYSDSTHHIRRHLEKAHSISIREGLLPDQQLPSNPFEAARVAGSQDALSHTPWQEDEFLKSYIDWVIANDVSFREAVSSATRGLLTWNRRPLLNALPSSAGTLSEYIMKALNRRKTQIEALLATSSSLISLSIDIWTSPNHLSFLGVVAHFVGMKAH